MPKETKNCRFAGVSVTYDTPSPGVHTPHFHATELHKKIAVWIKVPGRAMHTYIELPHDMTKLEALHYCLTAKEFQDPYVHDYLLKKAAEHDPTRKEEVIQQKKVRRKELRQEQKRLGITKIKRTRKFKASEATFGDDDFDENDIPYIIKESKNGK